MQNYGQAPGYQRPGSTTSFPGQTYGGMSPQGYQTAAPQAQSQWAAPNPTQNTNQWNQPQQQPAGAYNPGTYGAMPGGYVQGQQAHNIQQQQPQPQQQPPPPPPKPYGFAGAVQNQQQQQQQQQSTQNWTQQPQQNTTFTPPQQGGYPVQGTPQQAYNQPAPPPPSAPPGGSYYQPSQVGPGSNYTSSPTANPPPGAYGPPPAAPSWQQGQHGQHQAGGTQNLAYTKPAVDPKFPAQGFQGSQPQQPFGQPAQNQFTTQGQLPQQAPATQNQFSQQQSYGQTVPPQNQYQQPAQQTQYNHTPQGQHTQQPPQQIQYNHAPQGQHAQQPPAYSQQPAQWQSPAPAVQGHGQQQNTQTPSGPQQQSQWQPGHHAQGSLPGQQPSQVPYQGIQAPKPLSRTDTASSNFFNQSSPQSPPVSPVINRQSMSLPSGNQTGLGRAGSVSSIALANLQAQRADNRTNSPKPASVKLPTPPPPRDHKSKFSALGTGGPSDWEHFGADDEVDDEYIFGKNNEKKNEPVQLDSVELPAQVPSAQSTQGWPSPATHTAPPNLGAKRDSYAPTPPPAASSPAKRPPFELPQQNFVMGDATVAPLRTSPRPTQFPQAPPTQQNFTMEGGTIAAQSTPSQARGQSHAQEPQSQHSIATGFVQNGGGWGTQTSTQAHGAWDTQPNNNHVAELKAKQEALEHLRTESERLKNDLHAEIERLKTENEIAKQHTAEETKILQDQIEAMKTATVEAKSNTDAMLKEKDMMIERLKEDSEGKEHNIKERDIQVTELRQQLEAEKTKEPAKPTPADLISDINPWYVTSLERYIDMLRGEESEAEVENKIAIFTAFLRAESAVRGIKYYDAPPPAPAPDTTKSPEIEQPDLTRGTPNNSVQKPDLNVRVPVESPTSEDYDISPGGRPIFRPKGSLPPRESAPAQQHFQPSEQSILTPPTAASEDGFSETAATQVAEEQAKPQYKAYVPPVGNPQKEATSPVHRQSMSFANFPTATNTSGPSQGGDEIFFGAHEPKVPKAVEKGPSKGGNEIFFSAREPEALKAVEKGPSKGGDEIFFGAHEPEVSKAVEKSPSSDTNSSDIPALAPLALSTSRPTPAVHPSGTVPGKSLADLLPSSIISAGHNQSVERLRSQMAAIRDDSSNIEALTKSWEKSASLIRRKNDSARRARQEESEDRNEELFNNNEISYAEISQWEADQKEKEGALKAQEDRDEYKSYVETVFDPVYDGLQADIKSLMDLYIEGESMLPNSVAGVKSLQDGNAPSTKACLELLMDMHEQIEKRQEKIVFTVAERDKRYKKTEIQPLYAAGNIAKMKKVEKHFEEAEKQAVLRAKREKGERVGELVHMAEEIVVGAVGVEQGEIDHIIDAIKALEDGAGDVEVLNRAQIVLIDLKSSSKMLLELFNKLEIELNASILDTEIAEARTTSADAAKIQELEGEKVAGAKKMTDEFERRVTVLDQDNEEIETLIARKIGNVGKAGTAELTGEQEKERRLKTALEEAKRRNGHI